MALSPSRLALGAAGLVAVLLGCAALASQSKTSGPVEDYADPLAAAVSDVEQYGKQVSEYTAEMKRAGCNDITMLMNQNDHLHSAYARRMQRYQEQLPRREWHAVLALEERRVQPELHREYHAYTARLSLCASTSLGRARALVQKQVRCLLGKAHTAQESDLDAIMPVIDAAQCHDDSIKHVADRLHKLKFNFDQNLAAMRRELGYKHWHGIKVLEQATASQAFDSAQEALAEKQNWCAVHKFHTAMTEHYHRLHDLRAHIRHHVATHCAHNAAHIVMSGVHAAVDALEKDIATKPSLTEPAASELATRYVSHHLDHARSLAKHLLVHCRLSLARDAMTHSSTDDLSTHLNHLDAAMRHMMHGADDERKQLEDYARGSSSGSEGSEAADDFDKIFHSLNNGHHYEAHHAALYKAAAALAHHHGEHWRAALPLVQKRSRMARHAWFQVVAAPACRHLKGILQEYEHTVSPTLEDLDRHMAAAHPNDRAILDAYISLDALPAEARLSSTVASRWKACTIHLQAS